MSRFLGVGLMCLALSWSPLAEAIGITTQEPYVKSSYWVAKNQGGDKVILNKEGLAVYQAKLYANSPSLVDLVAYPSAVAGTTVASKLTKYDVLEDDLYLHGNKVSNNYKNILRQQTNVEALPAMVNVRYGIVVRTANLRTLPTGEGLFFYAGEKHFDALQETTFDPCEPVIILHQSANGYFYYVQGRNYSGWLSKFDVALADKSTWLTYAKPEKFLVVTDRSFTLKTDGQQVTYLQGATLPVVGEAGAYYTVQAPVRRSDGTLYKEKLNVALTNKAVHLGYLPYTSNNLVQCAFKFYGSPYGWGGLNHSVDCSALIYRAYKACGLVLPRNADEQEAALGKNLTFTKNKALADRYKQINKLAPGSVLFMPDHTMMYIGTYNGAPHAIHALGSYSDSGVKKQMMKVVVSDLGLQKVDGSSFGENLTSAVTYK